MSIRHLARERKREKLIELYSKRRNDLKKAQVDTNLSDEERHAAQQKLNALPRDSSPSRFSRRCSVTGTSRSVYRKFELNRISFRNMALAGLLPGVTKSSWQPVYLSVKSKPERLNAVMSDFDRSLIDHALYERNASALARSLVDGYLNRTAIVDYFFGQKEQNFHQKRLMPAKDLSYLKKLPLSTPYH